MQGRRGYPSVTLFVANIPDTAWPEVVGRTFVLAEDVGWQPLLHLTDGSGRLVFDGITETKDM